MSSKSLLQITRKLQLFEQSISKWYIGWVLINVKIVHIIINVTKYMRLKCIISAEIMHHSSFVANLESADFLIKDSEIIL